MGKVTGDSWEQERQMSSADALSDRSDWKATLFKMEQLQQRIERQQKEIRRLGIELRKKNLVILLVIISVIFLMFLGGCFVQGLTSATIETKIQENHRNDNSTLRLMDSVVRDWHGIDLTLSTEPTFEYRHEFGEPTGLKKMWYTINCDEGLEPRLETLQIDGVPAEIANASVWPECEGTKLNIYLPPDVKTITMEFVYVADRADHSTKFEITEEYYSIGRYQFNATYRVRIDGAATWSNGERLLQSILLIVVVIIFCIIIFAGRMAIHKLERSIQ